MRKRSFRKSRKKERILEKRTEEQIEQLEESPVVKDLDTNLARVKEILDDPIDLVIREFTIQYTPDRRAAAICLDELVDKEQVHNFILRPMMVQGEKLDVKTDLWDTAIGSLVHASETEVTTEMKKIIKGILCGDTVILIDGYAKSVIIGTKGWQTKSITEPRAESVIRGSREGLSETLNVSLGMIRRRLKDPNLRIKPFDLGMRTNTLVTLLYIEGVIDPLLVKEITNRLNKVKIDGVLESGYIEELIMDQVWSPFPQIQNTERPDAVVGHLLEGQAAIIVDGTPHVLIAPAIFAQFYHSPEDYYERYLIATALRLIRMISLFIALLLPALYIAFVSFHPEMIPSQLAIAMAAGRATVPFISILEALLMEFAVEVLREASIRLPGPIGPTIGIVGALVIGDAAVTAGLVSPAMVIVVGLTTISSYANPSYNAAISVRLLRFPFMIVASVLGLYGIMLCIFLMYLHLAQLKSFGVPYMAPYAPLKWRDLKDAFVRVPWKWMKNRPSLYRPHNQDRQKEGETK